MASNYGFQFINKNGIFQIDENYVNFHVYSQGAVSLVPFAYNYISVPKGALLFVRPTSYSTTIRYFLEIEEDYITHSRKYFSACVPNYNVPEDLSLTTATLEYMILVPGTFLVSDVKTGFGLNLYKTDGTLLFSSTLPSLAVEQVNTFTYNSLNGVNPTITINKASDSTFIEASCLINAINYSYNDGIDYSFVDVRSAVAFENATTISFRKVFQRGAPGAPGELIYAYNLTKNIILGRFG